MYTYDKCLQAKSDQKEKKTKRQKPLQVNRTLRN